MIPGIAYMGFSGGSRKTSLYQAISSLGLTANLKLCLDAGDLASYAGGAMTTTAGPTTLGTQAGSFPNYTLRQVIDSTVISTSGTSVIVAFGGDGSGTFTCSKAYIGEKSGTQGFASAPTQITFNGGSAGFTITDSQIIASDPISFTLDETKSYVISWLCPSSATDDFGRQTTLTGWSGYYKSGDDTTTQATSGYTTTDNVMGVYSVSVVTAGDGGQTWTDRSSSATNFYRGTSPLSDSADPTFNGSLGGLSSHEYWSSDGGDYFTVSAGNPSWVQPFHKDGATLTAMFGVYPSLGGGIAVSLFGDQGSAGSDIGVKFLIEATGNTLFWSVISSGVNASTKNSAMTMDNLAWNICGISVNENGGASAGIFFKNGSSETFDPSYSSPSASSATGTLQIGSGGAGVLQIPSGSRLAWAAIWDTALTATQMGNIYNSMRRRFGI